MVQFLNGAKRARGEDKVFKFPYITAQCYPHLPLVSDDFGPGLNARIRLTATITVNRRNKMANDSLGFETTFLLTFPINSLTLSKLNFVFGGDMICFFQI